MWTCKESPKYVSLLHNGKVVLRLDKGGLTALQLQSEIKKTKKTKKSKKKKSKSESVNKDDIMMFARAYQSQKAKYYKNKKLLESISLEGKNAKMFEKAFLLARRHKVQPKVLIEAQIHAFRNMNEGKGQFPYPAQLCNESAELRLLEYLKKDVKSLPQVSIKTDEKHLPLSQNTRYLSFMYKIKENRAKLSQALYCKEIQIIRRNGKVHSVITNYIDKLMKDSK